MASVWKEWWTAFLPAIGLTGTIATLIPGQTTSIRAVVAIVTALVAATAWAYSKTRPVHLPPADAVVVKKLGRLCFPCDKSHASQANAMAKRFYGAEAIPLATYELWRKTNPNILVCLTSTNNEVVGYFDVLPLKSPAMDMFIQGRIVEGDFQADDLYSPAEAADCDQLYLAGITVNEPGRQSDSRNASVLIWALVKYLQYFHPATAKTRDLYALASTLQGEGLIRAFDGFDVVTPASVRTDGHDLYRFRYSADQLDEALTMLPGWGARVPIPWEARPASLPAVSKTPGRPSKFRKRKARGERV